MPYTLDLPIGWLALPPACITSSSRDMVDVVGPGGPPTTFRVWRMDGFDGVPREKAYATIEARANRPLASGTVLPLMPVTVRRIDLPVGPALAITYATPASGAQTTDLQYLWYVVWIDGDILAFDFATTPDRFAELEPAFKTIAQTMRLKVPAPS
jgi:hypothetical protein